MSNSVKLLDEDVERFIEMVRMQAHLYDPSCAEHRDKRRLIYTWEGIASAMDIDYMQAGDWRKKWRNLRDVYVKKRREIRLARSAQAAEKAKHWRFFANLDFLEAYQEETNTDTSFVDGDASEMLVNESYLVTLANGEDEAEFDDMEDDTSTSITSTAINRPEFATITEDGVSRDGINFATANTVSSSRSTSHSAYPLRLSRKRKAQSDAMNGSLLLPAVKQEVKDEVNKHRWQGGHSVGKTADDVFFESCALRMKELPATMRSFMQLQISQLFLNAENIDNPQIPQIPITPLPVLQPVQPLVSASPVIKLENEPQHPS